MADTDDDKKCAGCGGCTDGCAGACGGCGREPRGKLDCYDWLSDIPAGDCDLVEVQFKNTRKGIYRNSTHLSLEVGDMVAVEAAPGHDIGRVTLTGPLVKLRLRRRSKNEPEIKRVFRKAKAADLEKYREARAREHQTMIRARRIADELGLNMKIGDVEFQGDGNKAIFYYIADERVDFRQLIKVLAEKFKVRIEMKQIGARQEAGRIGGIGPCGRPLCCSSWMTNFVSVATGAARYQDISLNPQKLAGQCAKLKCCLNFEVDAYVEAVKSLPSREIRLETADATYFHFKTDIFRRQITYSTDKRMAANLVTIDADRAFEVIALNKAGEKPLTLESEEQQARPKEAKAYGDLLGQDDLTRFDKKKKKKRKPKAKAPDAQEGTRQKPKGEGRPAPDKPQAAAPPQQQGAPSGKQSRRRRGRGGNRPEGSGDASNAKE